MRVLSARILTAPNSAAAAEARDRYDPFIDYRDSHMPTTGAEEGLIRWVYVETSTRIACPAEVRCLCLTRFLTV